MKRHLLTALVLAAPLPTQTGPTQIGPTQNGPTQNGPDPAAAARERAAAEALARTAAGSWFAQATQQVEAGAGAHHLVGSFRFANPHDRAVAWRDIEASCACSHLEIEVGDRRYWIKTKPREFVELVTAAGSDDVERVPVEGIAVPPRAAGVVEVHVDLHSSASKRQMLVNIHTDDDKAPMLRLQLDVSARPAIVVTPPELDLGVVSPDEQRAFEFEVHAPGQQDFGILSHSALPPGMAVEWTRVESNGVPVWRVKGTYGPIASGRGVGGMLKFATNSALQPAFNVTVRADVQPAIVITPGFVSLGPIRRDAGKRSEVRFHASRGADLECVAVRFEDLSDAASTVTTEVRKDGKDLVVEIVVPPGCPRGLLRGDLIVELNDGASPQRVLFNGFAR